MEARSLHRTQSRNYIKNSLWELSRHVTADNIKVKDLASYSGVSRTVFYRNFGCLSDVWHSIGHDVLNDIASSQELFYTDSGQGLRENVLQNVAACIYHSKDKIQNITSNMGTPSLFLNLKNKHKYGYSNVSANLNIGKRIYSKNKWHRFYLKLWFTPL